MQPYKSVIKEKTPTGKALALALIRTRTIVDIGDFNDLTSAKKAAIENMKLNKEEGNYFLVFCYQFNIKKGYVIWCDNDFQKFIGRIDKNLFKQYPKNIVSVLTKMGKEFLKYRRPMFFDLDKPEEDAE